MSFLYPDPESKPKVQHTNFLESDEQTKTEEIVVNENSSGSRMFKNKRKSILLSLPEVKKSNV